VTTHRGETALLKLVQVQASASTAVLNAAWCSFISTSSICSVHYWRSIINKQL